jgi:hypothetical protein
LVDGQTDALLLAGHRIAAGLGEVADDADRRNYKGDDDLHSAAAVPMG